MSVGLAAPAFGLGALADADAQKAAVKCQGLIAKTASKALATKLKAFNACAAAALACVETKADKSDCPAKAAATCTKKLGSAAAAALKAQGKITSNKSCLALGTTDLLGADGLGFGDIAGTCSADFDINVCDGLEPIAACVLATHDVGAGALFGRPAPRTRELLGLLPGAPFADASGLPPATGCGNCGAPAADRKSVEKCGKALDTATQAVAGALEGAFGKCTLELYECAQAKAGAAACVTAATAACTKAAPRVTKAVAKLGTVAAKACGAGFAAASAQSGLNLGALASRCATLGVTPLDGPTAVATCLADESRCAIAALVRNALPRTAELGAAAQFGALAADLGATCPTATTLQKSRAAVAPRGVFGSILKLVKSVRRTVPSALGVRTSGGKPGSTGGGSGVSKVSGPSKFTFGSIGKFKVTYHGNRSRIGGTGNDVPPPALIVAVSRPDIVLDDHFEIPTLTLPGDGSDIDDEIEVDFGDAIPACAFELSFTTKQGDDVGEYASILQVLDAEKPVLPSVELVSQGPAGVQQNGAASATGVAISATGRYVVFTSIADNLVTPIDGNGVTDVFLRDRCVADGIAVPGCTPATTIESNGPGGAGVAGHVAVSEDGRWVAFDVIRPNDPNPPFVQAYVRDRCLANGAPVDACTEITENVSFNSETFSTEGVLSGMTANGRFVTFTAPVPPLAVHFLDRCVSTNDTTDPVYPGCESFADRVSDLETGGPSNGDSTFGVASRNGRFTAFRSDATNVASGIEDVNGANDVFLHDSCFDFATGLNVPQCIRKTFRVNVTTSGSETAGDPSGSSLTNVALSDDGRFIAFASAADDVVEGGLDTNGKRDVFVHDRCVDPTGPIVDCIPTSERVNVGPGGTESNGDLPDGQALGMSADGRLVVFASDATNLLGPAVGTPNGTFQIYLRDRCLTNGVAIDGCTPSTTLVSTAPDKGLGIAASTAPAIAADGAATAFTSRAENLLGPGVDANKLTDVFVKDR